MFKFDRIIGNMGHHRARQGDLIYKRGSDSDGLIYVIMEGEIEEIRIYPKGTVGLQELTVGDHFGELEVFTDLQIRLQSFIVKSSYVKFGTLDKVIIKRLGGIFPDLYFHFLQSVVQKLHKSESELIKLEN